MASGRPIAIPPDRANDIAGRIKMGTPMKEPVETLLFDFGGTLDADGVAWKERFYTFYRAEGLDMAADAFASIFFAADDPLVGGLPTGTGLSGTVHALVANLEAELACVGAGTDQSGN